MPEALSLVLAWWRRASPQALRMLSIAAPISAHGSVAWALSIFTGGGGGAGTLAAAYGRSPASGWAFTLGVQRQRFGGGHESGRMQLPQSETLSFPCAPSRRGSEAPLPRLGPGAVASGSGGHNFLDSEWHHSH